MDSDTVIITLSDGERWWGGAVADGESMPFGSTPHTRDLAHSAGHPHDHGPEGGANQSAPVLVSSSGRYVWSDDPFTFSFDGRGTLRVKGRSVIHGEGPGSDLGSAFRAAAAHFPAAGRTPSEALLRAPQYNTWIELPYLPTQDGVLGYVRDLLDAGFPPGVVMIDDRWSVDYGDWRFDLRQFPDPAAMVATLHDWGCAVMLWVVPFVSPDSANFRTLVRDGGLITQPDGQPVVRQWWNGYSAVLDLTDPVGLRWFKAQLDDLVSAYGIDGFKFDAGDLRDYRDDDVTVAGTLTAQTEAYARLGTDYACNEFRACWKMGGQPLGQRLHDKPAEWGAGGLASLIPESIAQSLIGHAYTCPDMIGGGDLATLTGHDVDIELFVRYAQVAACTVMMQFSASPQRLLSGGHLAAVHAAVELHQSLVPEILTLAEHAAQTGEPILRPLAYHYPGCEEVTDQFLLGADLLFAPVLEAGATTRAVVIPVGRWAAPDGQVVEGPTVLDVAVDLESIPRWRRLG